jgi:hypothetical protein
METITTYLGINKNGNNVDLHYLESDELVKYTFTDESAAEAFYIACINLDALLEYCPKNQKESLHQSLIQKITTRKEYELITC